MLLKKKKRTRRERKRKRANKNCLWLFPLRKNHIDVAWQLFPRSDKITVSDVVECAVRRCRENIFCKSNFRNKNVIRAGWISLSFHHYIRLDVNWIFFNCVCISFYKFLSFLVKSILVNLSNPLPFFFISRLIDISYGKSDYLRWYLSRYGQSNSI